VYIRRNQLEITDSGTRTTFTFISIFFQNGIKVTAGRQLAPEELLIVPAARQTSIGIREFCDNLRRK
jgi:hypothetical protein